jgi:hypothetical protein
VPGRNAKARDFFLQHYGQFMPNYSVALGSEIHHWRHFREQR